MKVRNNDLSDRSIDIDMTDGVSIHLYKQEYDELVRLLIPEMEQEIKTAYLIQYKAMNERKDCWNFIKEIRGLFYDDSDGEFCIRKSVDELDEDRIIEVLEKYKKLLGFV
ncbi:hypothetical protein K6V26_04955 [Parabacteroides goldsteinii]|uniref:hypothetical protein n=1 Tax=Parabacteroides goldsteinii TaxID=328812 RepID=UPI001CCFF41F|nr:hypothetical protein [Parabacteroides goldsteinii]UBD75695.1 hypothetical protein K6V26_04955 [Parabacteroides goldsteinii]